MDNPENKKLIDLCSKKLEKEPNNIKALLLRTSSYINDEKYDKAEKDAKTIISIEPKNSTAYFLLGTIYDRQKKLEESLKLL